MVIVGWGVIALAVWLLDSAIRNRPPVQTLREILTTGELPVLGKSYPAASHAAAAAPAGTANSAGYAVPAGSGGAATSAQVNDWIAQANAILIANGVPASQLDVGAQQIIIQHESGGNPNAINLTDSNAAAGHPSIGIGQTIQSTFNSYALPGHTNIRNPVDNIIAFSRYAIGRYGGLSKVPGVISVRAGQAYRPY